MLERLYKMLVEVITQTNGTPKTVWLGKKACKDLHGELDNRAGYVTWDAVNELKLATPAGPVRVMDSGNSDRVVVSYEPAYPEWEGELRFKSMPWE